MSAAARRETPFAFYAKILGAGGARHHFLARLGAEANDALDEFLNLAIEYERRETPSLQGFMAWLREARAEVKRDMEIARDEVRVMTVHGAKGLEAPIVFLADTMTPPAGPRPPRLLELAGNAVIWVGRKADDPPPVAAARQDAQRDAADEYRRLLYVAMTRAADRLIICGAQGERRRPDGCWYDLVLRAAQTVPGRGDRRRGESVALSHGDESGRGTVAVNRRRTEIPDRPELPAWLRQRVAHEARRGGPISPSSVFDEDIARCRATRRLSGRAPQGLGARPDRASADAVIARHSAGAARDAIERFLVRTAAKDFSSAERAEIARQVSAILGDQALCRDLCAGKPSRSAHRRPHSAQRRPSRSASPDKWTACPSPATPSSSPITKPTASSRNSSKRCRTMSPSSRSIGRCSRRIYPGKTVRAALIFTNGPVLLEIPGAAMDGALETELCKVLT